jgi:4-carboxymuconolactone decarboxylase
MGALPFLRQPGDRAPSQTVVEERCGPGISAPCPRRLLSSRAFVAAVAATAWRNDSKPAAKEHHKEHEMARVDEVKRDDLDPRQQSLFDDIMRTRPRGKLSGPFSVWMHTPDIAEPANGLANCFRVHPRLDKRLIELITLMMCRAATVKYAWSVHEPLARQAGLSPQTIDAIRERKKPEFSRDDERHIYDLVNELIETKTVSAATFERAAAAFGRDGVIEAVSCAGFYGMIGFVLNTFEVPPQAGGEVLI